MRGNLGSNGLASREDSCVHPIPCPCMSVSVGFMVGVWVVFCVVLCPVFGACIPVVLKLVLQCTATEPPEVHIHHLALARDNGIVNSLTAKSILAGEKLVAMY